jgi:ribosomal protein S18 acetylase RimI-like enzyme
VCFVAVGDAAAEVAARIGADEIERAREAVVFTGWREDVRDLLAAADVFVLASWREGLPRSAIEAAALGKPLVLTDVRGNREVGRHGIEALIVPPHDAERLAEAIERLVLDRALRERLGTAARARAIERFDEERVKQALVDSYRSLLARKGRLPAERGAVQLRRALADDVAGLARLHRATLPKAFLPTLGERFLELLYSALVVDPDALVLVADAGGAPVGVVAGILSTRRFAKTFFRRYGLRAAAGAGVRLLQPRALSGALETRRAALGLVGLPRCQIFVLAVEPGRRGEGIGARLVRAVLNELSARGVDEVAVVTAATNAPANRLFERLGFVRTARIAVHDGVPSNVWIAACRS